MRPTGPPLAERFREVASSHGPRPALLLPAGEVTYAELDRLARVYAGGLLGRLGPGHQPVVLAGEIGAGLVASMLALAGLGRPFIYLDPGTGAQRLRQLPPEAAAVAVLTEGKPVLPEMGLPILASEELSLSGQAPGIPESSGDAVLSLLSTSGSQGRARWLRRGQAAVLANLDNYGQTMGLGLESRMAVTASPAYGPFTSQMFGALLHGALACPYDLRRHSLEELPAWLEYQRVTCLHLVPSVFRRLAYHLLGSGRKLPDLATLRLGGEPLRPSDLELFSRAFACQARLINGYSATEACGNIASQQLDPSASYPDGIPVGIPAPGRVVRIVDGDGGELPTGRSGRIVVAGSGLAGGYLDDEEANAGTFREGLGGIELWTGDLGRLDADGVLTHLGRLDRSVKVSGRWLSLEVAEATLAALPEVRAVHASRLEGDVLGLFVELHPELGAEYPNAEPAWRRRLGRELGMDLPWRILVLGSIPRHANGKPDGQALSRMLEGQTPRTSVHSTVDDPVTGVLRETLARLLGRPVGEGDNFFALGGTSLLAVEWKASLARLGWHLSLPSLSRSATLAELAREMRTTERGGRMHRLSEGKASNGRRLYLVPGGSGGPLEFFLLREMVAGLQADVLGLDASSDEPGVSLKELCDLSLPELRAAGRAPYLLLGWCSGARLACELAERLQKEGQAVRVLLVDPLPPDWRDTQARRRRTFMRGLLAGVARTGTHLRKLTTGPFRGRTAHANHLLRSLNLAMRGKTWIPPNFPEQDYQRLRAVYSNAMRAEPWRSYAIPVELFLTSDRWSGAARWRDFFPSQGLSVHRLEANHDDFTSTRVELTQRALNASLSKSDALPAPGH